MFQAIKKQLQAQWKNCLEMEELILAAGVFGLILFVIITRVTGEREEGIALGALLAGIAAIFAIFLYVAVQVSFSFALQVSMGFTRKQFLISWFAVEIGQGILAVILVVVFCLAENKLYPLLYPGIRMEVDFLPWILRYGLLAAAALPVLGSFCGVLVLRFGKRAFWALWVLWMGGWLGLPRILAASRDMPKSYLGKLGGALNQILVSVPIDGWVGLIFAAAVVAVILTWRILMRQQVKI